VTLIPAHFGHWYVEPAFAAPSLLIIGMIARDSVRRRRRDRERRGPREPPARNRN
jgi:hypothetical protein